MDDVLMAHLLRVAYEVKAHGLPYDQQHYFECGTPACMAGHCTSDMVFQNAGLKAFVGKHGYATAPAWGPDGDEWQGVDAMSNLLGLNWDQASYIFGGFREIMDLEDRPAVVCDTTSIDQTIRRIERVIDGYLSG